MNENDPEQLMPDNIRGIPVAQPESLSGEIPRYFKDIPDEVCRVVSLYMTVVKKVKKPEADVNIEMIIDNAKNMFRSGVKYNDTLWPQHCASSIREIITFIEPLDFHTAIKCISRPDDISDSDIQGLMGKFCNIKTYLSDVVHFVPEPRIGKVALIYPQDKFGTMNKTEFYSMEADIIERISIELIYTLFYIFKKYCIGN